MLKRIAPNEDMRDLRGFCCSEKSSLLSVDSEDAETFIPVLFGEGSQSRGNALRVDFEGLPQYVSRYIRSAHHENDILEVRSPVL